MPPAPDSALPEEKAVRAIRAGRNTFSLLSPAFAMIHTPADNPEFRPMREDDLAAMADIQRACYGRHMLEAPEILLQRLRCAADTCWVAVLEGKVRAYLAAYRSRLGKVTPLHAPFEPAQHPDTLYLHDLAVHPRAAGRSLGPSLVETLLALARRENLRYSALVSVQNSHAFWKRRGYADHALTDAAQRACLATYDDGRYMSRLLHPSTSQTPA